MPDKICIWLELMFNFSCFSQVPDDIGCIAPAHFLRHDPKSGFSAFSMVFVKDINAYALSPQNVQLSGIDCTKLTFKASVLKLGEHYMYM